ncbi:hypothetical protein BH18ACT1_BH18ACT1_15990 [soil metagenome]
MLRVPGLPDPLIPDYGGPCLSNVAPALLAAGDEPPAWLPTPAVGASQVVLLALDGLGWDQLDVRRSLAPTLATMEGGPISTVAPSTTATAPRSLAPGCSPSEQRVVGYQTKMRGDVLNVLRWQTPKGDARTILPPNEGQTRSAFLGRRPPVVTRAEFAGTGFTAAHLADVRFSGWRVTSTLVLEVRRHLAAGEPFVYAYYDWLDKVAHEYGLGEHY